MTESEQIVRYRKRAQDAEKALADLTEAAKGILNCVCYGKPSFSKKECSYYQFVGTDPVIRDLKKALGGEE